MAYNTLQLEYDDDILWVTFNRPEKRNAISPEMLAELLAALDEAESSPARVLILTGAGRAFCAGMDLEALEALRRAGDLDFGFGDDRSTLDLGAVPSVLNVPKAANQKVPAAALEDSRRIAGMFRRLYSFSKPVIAAVNGPAIAGGCGIATLSDFTLAVPEAKFGYTEVRIGFMPAIVSVFLIRQIGEKRARDLLLTGRIFDAEEARQMGLVNEIVPQEKLLERAREVAAMLLEASPTSLVYTKRLLREFLEAEMDRELELAIARNARIRSTADFREGLAAFLAKRKPIWRGE